MPPIHSKLAVVKLDTSGGVLTDISTYCNKCDPPRDLDLLKSTTFGATDHSFVTGFADGKWTMAGPWSRAIDNHMSPIFAAFKNSTLTSVSVEYAPEGTSAGSVKYTAELVMSKYSGPQADVEKLEEWSADFQVSGGVTVGAY